MFTPENTILCVIDIQGKLAHLMHDKAKFFLRASRLIQAAQYLDIPIMVTEQVPEKIGPTIKEISGLFEDFHPLAKASFSCCGDGQFMAELEQLGRKEVVIAGIETHVCVYQTACDLVQNGFKVQVVADAVASRSEADKQLALEKLRAGGAEVTGTEMIICELMRTAQHERFKDIIALIK